MKIKKEVITFVVGMIPTFIILHTLIYLFPFKGLGRILSYPFRIILNAVVVSITIYLLSKFNKRTSNTNWPVTYITWIIVFILNTVVAISLHPQENSPTVWQRIEYSVSAINKYDSLNISDIKKLDQDEYSFRNGNSELYVVALYKFKNDNHNLLSDIELMGYEKLIWNYLAMVK